MTEPRLQLPLVSTRFLSLSLVLLALSGAAVLMGGCSTQQQAQIPDIYTPQEFDQKVLGANKPVLVDFYKESCPTCVIQEADLAPLVSEYSGRVNVYRYKIRESTMKGAAPEIMERYELFWVPTVMLFVDGQPYEKWVFNQPTSTFRQALDEVLSQPQAGAAFLGTMPPLTRSLTGSLSAGAENQCIEGKGCPIDPIP